MQGPAGSHWSCRWLAQAQGLSATACCRAEPRSSSISHPWAWSHCPHPELCLAWVGMEDEASATLIFPVVLALPNPGLGYHCDIPGH